MLTYSFKVIGVGGCGINVVEQMLDNVANIEFMVADSDVAALATSNCSAKLNIGSDTNNDELNGFLQNTDMLFIVAGWGGHPGVKFAAEIAKRARENNILTIALIVKPLPIIAANDQLDYAEIAALTAIADSLICIDNNLIRQHLGGIASTEIIYAAANLQILNAVKGLTELLTHTGMLNLDFIDVNRVLDGNSIAAIGMGCASGDNRAINAAKKAISSPLFEDCNIKDAKGILVNIMSDRNITVDDIEAVGDLVEDIASEDATVLCGAGFDERLGDEVVITILVSWYEDQGKWLQ